MLAGGSGTRLRPLTYTRPKHLIPVGGKPILFYVLEQVASAGVREVGIIVAPETVGAFQAAVGDGSRFGLNVTFIVQEKPLGLAHAVQTGQPFLGDSPFMTFLGDNLLQETRAFTQEFLSDPDSSLIVVKKVPNPREFGVVEVNGRGNPVRLVEKPPQPRSDLAVVGLYFFQPVVHDIIAGLKPSGRGELELTEAIQKLIDAGHKVRVRELSGWWLDTGRKGDVLEANRRVMEGFSCSQIEGTVDDASSLTGVVVLGKGSVVTSSRIIGPSLVGEGCRLINAQVGPFASVGTGTRIEHSRVEDSILLEDCLISGVPGLKESLIGQRCRVVAKKDGPPWLELFLGDDAQVLL